jgi:hypothetical protein
MQTIYEASIIEDHECPTIIAYFAKEEHAKEALGSYKAVHKVMISEDGRVKPILIFDSFNEYEKYMEDKTLQSLLDRLTDEERTALNKRFPGVVNAKP